jgi:archaellum biogenesis ATPase FlaH
MAVKKVKSTLFNTLKKVSNNEFAFKANEENLYEVKNWIDTGCLILNAILSDGDTNKGIPEGKRVMISGESGVAKSLFVAIMIKAYLDQVPNSHAVMFESEASTVVEMAKQIGIPTERMLILPVQSVEDFREQAVRLLDKIIESRKAGQAAVDKANKSLKKGAKKKTYVQENFIFCVDSLGNLGTEKEYEDMKASKRVADMTRARMIKGMARTITLKISLAQIPFLVVNHTYAQMKEYAEDEISGGSGAKYMSDVSLVLTKAKEKENKKQTGIIITLKTRKSRYMKENKTVKVLISFSRGMYRYSDIVNKAYDLGVLKKAKNDEYKFPDGSIEKMKDVRAKTSKFFTGELMETLRAAIMADFGFGKDEEKSFEFFDDMDGDHDQVSDQETEDDIDLQLDEADQNE